MNSFIIGLLIILVIVYIIDMNQQDNFENLNNSDYASVDYNTRMDNGVETVIPEIKKLCKDNRFNSGDVRERYLARNVKLNNSVPVPNNTDNILNSVDNNINKKNSTDNQIYDNADIKSLNSMMDGQDYNTLNEVQDLLTLN